MKKIFVSQPMAGLTDDEIMANRRDIEKIAQLEYGDCEFLDTYFKDFDGNALAFLGKSILALSEADAAIFDTGWEDARGCWIEHKCCELYRVPTLDL
jgi:hypothetical protein